MELRSQENDTEKSVSSNSIAFIQAPSAFKFSKSVISTADAATTKGRTSNGTHAVLSSQPQTLSSHRHHYPQKQISQPDPVPDPNPPTVSSGSKAKAPTIKAAISVWYKECLKNHAASTGAHVMDGCGEFMPSGEEGYPEGLKCAACGCHRSFHRKEMDGYPKFKANCFLSYYPESKIHSFLRKGVHYPIYQLPPKAVTPVTTFGGARPTGGGGGGATDSSSEELNLFHSNNGGAFAAPPPSFALSKKRFRTRFTPEQKVKMLDFAEKIGWKIQKQDEPAVRQFCVQAGVKRHVLKVWIHNKKQAMKRRQEDLIIK